MTLDEIRKQLERDLDGALQEASRASDSGLLPDYVNARTIGYLEQSIRNAIRELGHVVPDQRLAAVIGIVDDWMDSGNSDDRSTRALLAICTAIRRIP